MTSNESGGTCEDRAKGPEVLEPPSFSVLPLVGLA
jgi:hypothetical protein